MKHAEYGFAGDDVDIEETITRHYKVKFLDYEIERQQKTFPPGIQKINQGKRSTADRKL